MFAYIDDFMIVSPKHKAEMAFHALYDLLTELGLPINPGKCNPLSKVLTCLGIEVNIKANTISITEAKINTILDECLSIYGKKRISRHTFQSLLGKLLYVHKCVHPACMFVNRILHLFRKNSWGNKVYSTPIFGIPEHYRNIVNLEMLNILIALRVSADQWAHKRVLFRCDNLAVVQVIRTNETRDEFLACCLRNIWLIVSIYDIKLQIQHISGKNNRVADALSRLYSDKPIADDLKCDLDTKYRFYQVSPTYFNLDLTI